MSSSDRLMSAPELSTQRVLLGERGSTTGMKVDTRPQTVQDAEQRHALRITALQEQHQIALEAAYRNGYNDGGELARADTHAELERTAKLNASLLTEFTATRRDWFATCEQQTVELVCHAVEAVLGERPPDADRILHALQKAFACLDESDRVTVRCHPDDAEFLRASIARPGSEIAGSRRVKLVADDGVQPGGCLVETELGVVDARVEQQLRILRGSLLDASTIAQTTDPESSGQPEH
jgi:flagellar biosynthesis/type III secretory pathway protein FliH